MNERLDYKFFFVELTKRLCLVVEMHPLQSTYTNDLSYKNTNFFDSVDMHIAKANEERKKFDIKQSILLKCCCLVGKVVDFAHRSVERWFA